MGLITRCSSCGTMFKVVADQLRISEGWVRCGHCAEIFDATADLRDESQLDAPAAATQEGVLSEMRQRAGTQGALSSARPPDADADTDVRSSPDAGSGLAAAAAAAAGAATGAERTVADVEPPSEYSSSLHSEVRDSALDAPANPAEIEQAAETLREDPLDTPFELRRADSGDLEEAGPHGFSKPMPLETEAQLEDLSFVREARRSAFWRRPGVRMVLVLVAIALGAALAAQVAFQNRDRLAAASPQLRPALARMCALLGCRIEPPQLIENVGIETSSFNKLRGDTYRLNVTLKNQASVTVAMPALELTLTDAQDEAVLRRVLQPAEFAPGRVSLAPSADWSTSVGVTINAGVGPSRIAGYRLLAFYP